jgi:hypothetical protein
MMFMEAGIFFFDLIGEHGRSFKFLLLHFTKLIIGLEHDRVACVHHSACVCVFMCVYVCVRLCFVARPYHYMCTLNC